MFFPLANPTFALLSSTSFSPLSVVINVGRWGLNSTSDRHTKRPEAKQRCRLKKKSEGVGVPLSVV